jgi:hypothetical protein
MSTFFGDEVDEARNESCSAGRKKGKETARERESAVFVGSFPLSWLVVRREAQVCMYMYVCV